MEGCDCSDVASISIACIQVDFVPPVFRKAVRGVIVQMLASSLCIYVDRLCTTSVQESSEGCDCSDVSISFVYICG